jgi:serine/threonine protein kinase/tetratricopeptide (TPR) repeat protein
MKDHGRGTDAVDSSSLIPPPPVQGLTPAAAESLATKLVGEMIQRWRRGERLLPEDFLGQHPGLWDHPEAAADLIYEEICLRQEYGPVVPIEQVLGRFPQWRPQLEVLFECQRLLGPRRVAPQFPAVGEALGDFLLLAELGRGAQGRVFVASQLSLGDRTVVLKLMPCEAGEHLSQASLQHTHIVPLYSVQDHPARGLRALCMPYFGGATLAQLLEAMPGKPPSRRTGQDLLGTLDRVQDAVSLVAPARGPARRSLARASYAQAVCWVVACLADALQYAHERGLLHLDLKPSNVLLAADGQPMLLDFHLARGPIYPDGQGPQRLGGTTAYMSPEQQAAVLAIQRGRPVSQAVDGRSDIYALGVVLSEALGGGPPEPGVRPRPLHRGNPQVSVGLADIVGKCLADDPEDRYPHMAALAADLRRHLADQPLAGVRNRSPAELWRKWRRRRPHGLAFAGMMLAALTAATAATIGVAGDFLRQADQARKALDDGQAQMTKGQWEGAIDTLQGGLTVARGLPFRHALADELDRSLRLAQLHELTVRIRFLYGADRVSPGSLSEIEAPCRALWENRRRIVRRLGPDRDPALEPLVHDDLLDLGIFWADLQVRLAPPTATEEARRRALTVLDEAESLFGPSPVLDQERALRDEDGGRTKDGRDHHPNSSVLRPPSSRESAWEHYALGRALLRSGDLQRAAEEVDRAVRLQPQGRWPNFYQGLCAYRLGRFEDAALAYSVCIGAAPEAAGCFYNRALAFDALGRTDRALRDYDRALQLDPNLASAALNRGMLHYRARRHADARADLRRALDLKADPAVVWFDLALVDLALENTDAALDDLRRALGHAPDHRDARLLYDRLQDHARRLGSIPPTSSRAKAIAESAPASGPESR